jgi:predicted nucleic acid-binding protein
LSAAVGGSAQRIFSEYDLHVHAAKFNLLEVEEYLPAMAAKYGLPFELVLLRWKLLPLSEHNKSDYQKEYPKALADLKNRDPEDAHALALARALRLPLWSNDRDLAGFDVLCLSTAKLLKKLILNKQKRII